MTFVIRGSGYVSRKLACVAGAGEPLPQDLQPYMETLSRYRQQIMLLAWKLEEAEPTSEQLEVQPDPAPCSDSDLALQGAKEPGSNRQRSL